VALAQVLLVILNQASLKGRASHAPRFRCDQQLQHLKPSVVNEDGDAVDAHVVANLGDSNPALAGALYLARLAAARLHCFPTFARTAA
jgi:hypothetical protein